MHSALSVRSDLGHRVELVSMDPHFGDISVGLYVRDSVEGSIGTVHSYSHRPGTVQRTAAIARTMCELGGLVAVDDTEVRFACATWHGAAAKRLFIEACKHDPTVPTVLSSLEARDARSGQLIRVVPGVGGAYEVLAEDVTDEVASRAPAIARAMAKLAELETRCEDPPTVAFPCGVRHDELIGLLLRRAQNLRQILREEELQAGRGVLSAPGAQE
jgi:hypothetical protein